MDVVHLVDVDPSSAQIGEQGWQSWSPSTSYLVGDEPFRARSDRTQLLCYRPGQPRDPGTFRSEGVLAVEETAGGRVHVIASPTPTTSVPTIAASVSGDTVTVSADGPVVVTTDDGPDGIDGALARWADRVASAAGVAIRSAPTVWCSWYHYFTRVTQEDVEENLAAITARELPVDVVQIDDGYQREIGDWLTSSSRFDSVRGLFDRIREAGYGAGVWTAPFFVGAHSAAATEHPERLVRDPRGRPVVAGRHWGQDLYALDTTHPSSEQWLREVFGWFGEAGITYHKIDFVYAAAVEGVRHEDVDPISAYRQGLELVREAIGDGYLLGCGAPQLPSIGLVDAMRVSPDTEPSYRPRDGDMSQPSVLAASVTGRARAFMHGRFWINDADCLIVRPGVERRADWAAHVEAFGGLRASSDRIEALDDWGLATTRRILSTSPTDPFIPA